MTRVATCLMSLFVAVACSRSAGQDGPLPNLETRIVGELPFHRHADGRRAARDVIVAEMRWLEGFRHGQGSEKEVEERVVEVLVELHALPPHERYVHLRLMALDGMLDTISLLAQQLAYRRLSIEHPEVFAVLPEDDDDLQRLRRAPTLDVAEIDRRVAALEQELDEVLARYGDVVTPYVDCTQHVSDQIKAVRAMLSSARGRLAVTSGPVLRLLRRAAPHIATHAANPADLGQPYPWPSCEQYRR